MVQETSVDLFECLSSLVVEANYHYIPASTWNRTQDACMGWICLNHWTMLSSQVMITMINVSLNLPLPLDYAVLTSYDNYDQCIPESASPTGLCCPHKLWQLWSMYPWIWLNNQQIFLMEYKCGCVLLIWSECPIFQQLSIGYIISCHIHYTFFKTILEIVIFLSILS